MEAFDLGLRLKELREKKKLSQSQAAARLGLSKSSVSCYENNLTMPSIDALMKMALLYRVTLDYLLGMEKRRVIVLDGLTERDCNVIESIVDTLIYDYKTR